MLFRSVANEKDISPNDLPPHYLQLGTATWLGLPVLAYLAVMIVLVAALLLRYTRFGRSIYAVGSNPAGAALLGIHTKRIVVAVYVLSGALGGLAGYCWGALYGTLLSTSALKYELTVIAAVVVGGVDFRGGRGTVLGAFFGVCLLSITNNIISLSNINQMYLNGVYGAIIIVSVATYTQISKRVEGKPAIRVSRVRSSASGQEAS